MPAQVVIAGAGIVGFEVARRLERVDHIAVTLLNPGGMMVYRSLLPELAAGVIEPRHAVIPLRSGLSRARVLDGELTGRDGERRVAHVLLRDRSHDEVPYDHLVVALGSITNLLPVPGLAEHAVGFQTVAEALHLRDRVLDRLQLAAATRDEQVRRRALTFVVVGGGYSGVEAIGELQSLAVDACGAFGHIEPSDMRWLLVEASDTILPMVRPSLRRHVLRALEQRGIDVRLQTLLDSVDDGLVGLSDGTQLAADTLVWCAGARPHPDVDRLDLPLDEDGRVVVDARLRVDGAPGVWSAGDCAAVPDLVRGGLCPPSAQYALRHARRLADNLIRVVERQEPRDFSYRQRGELITFGRYQAVGEVLGLPLRGRVPWLARHAYHIARIPTAVRKVRLWIDWTVNLLFPREITDLGSVRDPRAPIEEAADALGDEAEQRRAG